MTSQTRLSKIIIYTGLLSLFALGISHKTLASTLPQGFSESIVAPGLNQPIAMALAPDGRIFVTEKPGTIRIIKNGTLLSTPFVSINVDSYAERGLLGIALDPDFQNNRYVYVYYTKPGSTPVNRVSRFTASQNSDTAEAGSEVVLLDNIGSDSGIHNGGAVRFGTDGKLYIATGDTGFGSTYPQNLQKLSGKVLRINKDGTIPSDNPFVGRSDARPEIYAYGLRNPFSFAVNPVTGAIFLNDVGQDTWEEVNEIKAGANYGWPQCEGMCNQPGFTNPIYTYNHTVGKSVTGGTFYTGQQFPDAFKGKYFFGDYVNNFLKALDPVTYQVSDFATGVQAPVDLNMNSQGELLYLSITNGALYKISYSTTTVIVNPPTDSTIKIYAAGVQARGVYPTMQLLLNDQVVKTFSNVQGNADGRQFQEFLYSQSSKINPRQVKVAYTNDEYFGNEDRNLRIDKIVVDGTTYEAEADTTYSTGTWTPDTNCAPGNKKSEWLQCGGYLQFQPNDVSTSTNKLPQGTITVSAPRTNNNYYAGDMVSFSGTATDPEDGILPASAYSWRVVFHHDTHTHPFLGPITSTTTGSFQIPQTGEPAPNTWYRVYLTVTDSKGATSETYKDVFPKTTDITVTTDVAGLNIELDGQPKLAPYTFTGVVGYKRTISAPSPQSLNGKTYEFVSWSDTLAQTHTIDTPESSTTYTAHFKESLSTTTTTQEFTPMLNATIVNPSEVILGQQASITTTIKNNGKAGSMLVDIEAYKDGAKVAQQYFDNVSMSALESKDFTYSWTPTQVGIYKVSIGIFKPGWSQLYSWNSEVSQFVAKTNGTTTTNEIVIYSDSLLPGWENWSWETDTDFNSTSQGSPSIKVSFKSPWAGLFLHTGSISTNNFNSLTFMINGGTNGGQSLKLLTYNSSGNVISQKELAPYIQGGIKPNAWSTVSIPLADIQAQNQNLSGFAIQGSNGATQSQFFIDNFKIQ